MPQALSAKESTAHRYGEEIPPDPGGKTRATVITMGKGRGRPRRRRKDKRKRFQNDPDTQPATRWKRGSSERIVVKAPATVLKRTAARDRKFGINRQKEAEEDAELERRFQQEKAGIEVIELHDTDSDSLGIGGRELPRTEPELPEPSVREQDLSKKKKYGMGYHPPAAEFHQMFYGGQQEPVHPADAPSLTPTEPLSTYSPSLRSIASAGTQDTGDLIRLLRETNSSPQRAPSPPPSRNPFPFQPSGPPVSPGDRAAFIRGATSRFRHVEKVKGIARRNTRRAAERGLLPTFESGYSMERRPSKRTERRAQLDKWRAQKRAKQKQMLGVPQQATTEKKLQIQKVSEQEYMVRSSGLSDKVRLQVKQLVARVKKRMYVNGKYMTKRNALKKIIELLSQGQVVKIRFSK